MIKEVFAENLVTPTKSGRFLRQTKRRLVLAEGKIRSVEAVSTQDWKNLSTKSPKFRCLIPGLIDPHTHLVFAGNRTDEWAMRLKGADYEKIAKAGGGIKRSVRMTRLAKESELIALAKKRLKTFLQYGVTTLEVKSGYGLDMETELRVLKIIKKLKKLTPQTLLATFLGAHALPPEFSTTDEYVDWLIEKVLAKAEGLADFQDVFVERGYFGPKESVRLLEAGKKYGLKPKVHAHEFGRTGGVEVAAKVKAVSADHLQYMSDADIRAMKKAGVVAVVLPGTSLFLGAKKFAPARKMWDSGLKVAIATDFNPGTNPSMNFPLMGSLGAILEGLNLDEVLTAQTYHAALALGLKDRGILQASYRADFVALDVDSFEEIYYHYGLNFVEAVFIHGKKVQ